MPDPPTVETGRAGTAGDAPVFPDDERLEPAQAHRLAGELGLDDDEYDAVVDRLGRVPTRAELGMYSVMWSEHCSYKSSKSHLATLDATGPRVLVGPGENAGVVDVGDGMAVAFKIESHNHPSFVEPYQGAATGVGGIIRDILTMGARPIALMDPLRFGHPSPAEAGGAGTAAEAAFQRHLIDGVVRGVGGYGNCVGVANIGGETVFDDAYADNPLVNVLCVGVVDAERVQLARAQQPGDVAVLIGSATGRDGIGGASVLASAEFDDADPDRRPNVQVGDPFAEKQLIEACLELFDRELLSGIQDMGAAGIACSTAEMASAAGLGMRVDLDGVHLRTVDEGAEIASWEILCSESQERMLALVAPEYLDEVLAVCDTWDVPASPVGEVVPGDRLEIHRGGDVVADVPASSLADEGPTYRRPATRPDWQDGYAAVDAEDVDVPDDLAALAERLLASPNVASKRWVYQQYDQLVGFSTVAPPGGDAGVARLPAVGKGPPGADSASRRGVAVSTDGNGRWCALDPREGTRRVVAEAARNVACTGARPVAATNCLNFGNPEREAIMWQFAEAVAGLGEACRALGTPVTGGNVSFYNETRARAVHPTPVIGVLGVLDDVGQAVGIGFGAAGDAVYQVGAPTRPGLAGSELQRLLAAETGRPDLGGTLEPIDLDAEARLQQLLVAAAGDGLLASAHDVSDGGLVATVAESCLAGDIGVTYEPEDGIGPVQVLCSESPSRVIVSVADSRTDAFEALAADHDVFIRRAGTVGGGRLSVDGLVDLALDGVRATHEDTLASILDPQQEA